MDDINILVTINRNFIVQLKAMLHSLFINNSDSKINIFLMHSELTEEDLSLIEKTIKRYNGSFFPCFVDKECDSVFRISPMFPPEACYRLLAIDYIPPRIKKILYLDSDIIINGSIAPIYNKKMLVTDNGKTTAHYLFAAAVDTVEFQKDPSLRIAMKERLGLLPSQMYVNSGVLMINLELLRKVITTAEIIDLIIENRDLFVYPDQDFINMVFNKYILYLNPVQYNFNPMCSGAGEGLHDNLKVMHFYGFRKPWNADYPQNTPETIEAKMLYEKYASMDF